DGSIDARQAERDDALRALNDAHRARQELERSGAVAARELERRADLEELEQAVRGWRIVRLAAALIGDTLAEFERTRQPAVLEQATALFAEVTDGRFQRLVQERDGGTIELLDGHGRRLAVEALSRGTAEQLYICMRLGLAAEFANRSTELPMVMDDVLVNFDPERARRMAAVLGRHAAGHQLIYFTCHPATRDLLVEHAGDTGEVHVIELPVVDVGATPVDSEDGVTDGQQSLSV
ncbi:MAG: hypothetical protein PVF43_08250, partial [Candidatus Eiseniibacteriota bacterium]